MMLQQQSGEIALVGSMLNMINALICLGELMFVSLGYSLQCNLFTRDFDIFYMSFSQRNCSIC